MNRSLQSTWLVAGVVLLLAVGCAGRLHRQPVKTAPAGTSESRGRETSGRDLTDEELETRVKAYANFAAGISADLNDDEAAAVDHWLKSAQADPDHEVLMLTLGARLVASRQSDKAIPLLERAASATNASAGLYILLGTAYMDTGKTNLAFKAFHHAVERAPDDLNGYRNLFILYRDSRQFAEALQALDDASASLSQEPGFWAELAELYAQYAQLRREEADAVKAKTLVALNRASSLISSVDEENQMLVLKVADGYRLMGDRAQAEKWYLLLVDRLPPFAGVREKLADIYLRDGKKDKAAEQLQAIAKDNPRNEQAYYLLGTIAAQERRFGDADDYYQQAISLRPDFKPAYYDLATVKITLNKPADALQILARARSRFGLDFALEFYSGLAQMKLKQYAEAVRSFNEAEVIAKAGERDRLTHIFYHQFGSALERKGDHTEAEKYFRQSLALSPDFSESLNYLGYMWAERGVNLQEARQFIEKAVALEPDNPAYLDSMAWVLFKMGEAKEALPWMEKAVDRNEEPDPTLYDHLGDIYAALGQTARARDAWRKSLALEFTDQVNRKLNPEPANPKPK